MEGTSLAIYLEMKESEQADAGKIETRLKEVFTDGTFNAYGTSGKLVNMRCTDEQVDIDANEIRRLDGLARFTGDNVEYIVRLTFLNGFSDHITMELKQTEKIEKLPVCVILSRARVMIANKTR